MENNGPGYDEHVQHQIHRLEGRKQLWFGAPADLVQLIEEHEASLDSRHYVFWLDFGGMTPVSVHRSMNLLAQEVLPHFVQQAS